MSAREWSDAKNRSPRRARAPRLPPISQLARAAHRPLPFAHARLRRGARLAACGPPIAIPNLASGTPGQHPFADPHKHVLDERPEDPVVLFNLGRTRLRLDRVTDAVPPLTRCLGSLPAELTQILRTAYALLVEAHCRLGQSQAALAVCLEGRSRYPDNLELLLAEGLVRRDLGDTPGAAACLLELLRRDPANAAARIHLNRLQAVSTYSFTV